MNCRELFKMLLILCFAGVQFATTHAQGGASVLNLAKTTLPFYGAKVIDTFSLPSFNQNFNVEKGIINAEFSAELKAKLEKLKAEFLK